MKLTLNVLLVILHAEHVLITQVAVLVVTQEKDSFKLLNHLKVVSNNALKELIPRTMFVKFVTSNVPNVWVLLETVLLVQLEDSSIMVPVGTFVQESLSTISALTHVPKDITDSQINSVKNVIKIATLVTMLILVQHAKINYYR